MAQQAELRLRQIEVGHLQREQDLVKQCEQHKLTIERIKLDYEHVNSEAQGGQQVRSELEILKMELQRRDQHWRQDKQDTMMKCERRLQDEQLAAVDAVNAVKKEKQ
jgi:hypothetical protein